MFTKVYLQRRFLSALGVGAFAPTPRDSDLFFYQAYPPEGETHCARLRRLHDSSLRSHDKTQQAALF